MSRFFTGSPADKAVWMLIGGIVAAVIACREDSEPVDERIAMTNSLTSYVNFFWAGLLKHGQTGGLVPSQRFLIAKMIAPIPESYRGQIVELGAGSGALTLRLAARCPGARILACEINPTLARDSKEHVRKIIFDDVWQGGRA